MAIELTQETGRRIPTVTEDTRETTFLFQRLSMALQWGNAVSIDHRVKCRCNLQPHYISYSNFHDYIGLRV